MVRREYTAEEPFGASATSWIITCFKTSLGRKARVDLDFATSDQLCLERTGPGATKNEVLLAEGFREGVGGQSEKE